VPDRPRVVRGALAFDQHLDRSTFPALVTLQRDSLLKLHNLVPPPLDDMVAHLARQFRGRRARLARVGEHTDSVEPRLLQELQQRCEFLACLAWVTDDKRRAQSDIGHSRAQVVDDPQCPLAVGRATHAAQCRGMSVLERHIKIGTDLGMARHCLDQLWRDTMRVGVHQSQPGFLRQHSTQLVEQRRQPILELQVAAIIRQVLGYENDLFYTLCGQLLSLAEDRADGLGAHIAFE
jgi:hypothetical protein